MEGSRFRWNTVTLFDDDIHFTFLTGHNIAKLDPLGINSADLDDSMPPELKVGKDLDLDKACQ